MASIKKRSTARGDTRYDVRYRTPDGSAQARTFRTRRDAERFAATTEADKARGSWIDPAAGRQTFEAFADEWSAAQSWKATTRQGWPYHRARLVDVFGSLPLSAIDRLALQRAQRELGERFARSTVTTTMSYARSIMRAAFVAGRIGRDPTSGLRRPKVRAGEADGKVGPENVPTRDDVLAILHGAPAPYRAAIALGTTGLRVGEVLGLTVDRLDLADRLVTIDRQLQRVGDELSLTTPKAEKVRTIRVPGAVALELRRHVREHQGDGLLFRTPRSGEPMRRDQFYASAWRPALVGAGLDDDRYRFHALRHFAASSMLAEGVPITAVAGHLGDTVETLSRVYVHWLRDDRDVPAEVLDRLLDPSTGSDRAIDAR